MIKLALAISIFVLFVFIFLLKKLGSGAKDVWDAANSMADSKLKGKSSVGKATSILPTVAERTEAQADSFGNFMRGQSLLLDLDGTGPSLETERERKLYIHFLTGAADRLSRTISDASDSELWFTTTTLAQACLVCGYQEATRILESYGSSGDASLYSAGQLGWESMSVYLSASEVSDQEFKGMMLNLYRVVKKEAHLET